MYISNIAWNACLGVMVFNVTFNNISAISWRSVLLVDETGILGENHWPAASHWQTLSHNIVSSTPRHERAGNTCWSLSITVSSLYNRYFNVSNLSSPYVINHNNRYLVSNRLISMLCYVTTKANTFDCYLKS